MSIKANNKKVMNLAWRLATNAQARFGGKKSEYLALCLKEAWVLIKKLATPSIIVQPTQKPSIVATAMPTKRSVKPIVKKNWRTPKANPLGSNMDSVFRTTSYRW